MGACLSCIRGESDDSGEESLLLKGQQQMYGNDVEESVLKQQQRQQELNTIVNDLTDSLIDVSLFLNTSTGGTMINLPVLRDSETGEDSNIITRTTSTVFPIFMNNQEKIKLSKKVNELSDEIKQSCRVECEEKLYLKF